MATQTVGSSPRSVAGQVRNLASMRYCEHLRTWCFVKGVHGLVPRSGGREVVGIDISMAAGRELRRVRRERGLTLQDVRRRSRNRFKPSALGSHERGQRGLSLARFCELAWLYGIPPDQLLAEVLRSGGVSGGIEVVIDLDRLSMSRDPEITLLAEHVDRVRSLRHDFLANVITLRSGDIAALAGRAQIRPVELLGRLAGLLHRAPRPGA